MSFGKDDSNLGRIGTYGATAQQMGNASRRQSVARKGSPPWANNYQPSTGSPDTIRLIPGDFEAERINKDTGAVFTEKVPWKEYTEHFHGGIKKGMTCSGGVFRMADRKRAQPCRGCDIWREDFNVRQQIEREKGVRPQQPNRVSFSNKYAFIALDMGWFFKGFRYDENGRPKVGSNGQAFMDWIKYNDQNYNIYAATQRDLAVQNKAVETQQGLVRSWPVGQTQFEALTGFAEMAQKHCKNCGGMNCIHVQSYNCPHCQAPTFMSHETTMPADKIKEVVNGITVCRNCRQPGYPQAINSCQHCSNPSPATLYDVDLQIQSMKVNKTYQLHLAGMSNPKPIDGAFAELLKKLPELDKKFAPTPYDEQIALFGPPPSGAGTGVASQQQFTQAPQQPPQQQHYGQPQGFQTPAFGGYGTPQYSGAQTPPQAIPTQVWNGNGWNNGQQ